MDDMVLMTERDRLGYNHVLIVVKGDRAIARAKPTSAAGTMTIEARTILAIVSAADEKI